MRDLPKTARGQIACAAVYGIGGRRSCRSSEAPRSSVTGNSSIRCNSSVRESGLAKALHDKRKARWDASTLPLIFTDLLNRSLTGPHNDMDSENEALAVLPSPEQPTCLPKGAHQGKISILSVRFACLRSRPSQTLHPWRSFRATSGGVFAPVAGPGPVAFRPQHCLSALFIGLQHRTSAPKAQKSKAA